MIEVLAWLLSAAPIAAAAALGHSLGAGRVLAFCGRVALSWAAGWVVALLFLRVGLLQPFGLVTPLVAGLLAAIAARRLTARARAGLVKTRIARASWVSRIAGAACGGLVCTGAVAVFWITATLLRETLWTCHTPPPAGSVVEAASERPAEARSGFAALLHTAHHGFVRHLPVLGSLGDEVEAVGIILHADPRLKAQLAREAGWEALADLPSLRAILDDRETLEQIDGLREGRLTALYDLQRNPRILAFVAEPEVQRLIVQTRPTDLAKLLQSKN